jgi:tight adherence protein C
MSVDESLIVLLAAVSVGFAALFVYRATLVRDPLSGRLARIEAGREGLRQSALANKRRGRREQSLSTIHKIVEPLKLLKSREADKAALKLAQAGLRSRDALVVYFFAKLALPFVFGALALFALYVLQVVELEETWRPVAALAAVIVGAYAPEVFVKNAITKRRKALKKGVPDTLDLLVICAEAGQSLDGALQRVAAEAGLFCPEMAEEISITSLEIGMIPERRTALENLMRRTGLPEIRSVVNALIQTEKYGTPLAQSLRVLAAEYRNDRMMRAEEKAARLPAIMTVPMIIFILPPLFVVLLGPAIIEVLDTLMKL